MELLEMIVISLQITALFAKKKHRNLDRHAASSEESIENLLYYKDCKHKPPVPRAEPLIMSTEAPKQPACPCPKMCCSMCCECNAPGFQQSFIGRQMTPLQMPTMDQPQLQVAPQPQPPRRPLSIQPQISQLGKKQRANLMKGDPMMQRPIGSRRGFGFTRENIKSLISQDQDIKKILKDLVRVTMHKVDLVERVKSRRSLQVSDKKLKTVPTEPPYTDDELREEM